ncbi:MAG: hypothetical protein AAGJ70_05215, partial [Pseudomonadota bacterium]
MSDASPKGHSGQTIRLLPLQVRNLNLTIDGNNLLNNVSFELANPMMMVMPGFASSNETLL